MAVSAVVTANARAGSDFTITIAGGNASADYFLRTTNADGAVYDTAFSVDGSGDAVVLVPATMPPGAVTFDVIPNPSLASVASATSAVVMP